jgi:hypothetical protein
VQKAVGNCFALLLPLLLLSISSSAQQVKDGIDKIVSFPDKLLSGIQKKNAALNERLEKQTVKYLQRLAKREERLQRRLAKIDSTKAKQLFATSPAEYAALTQKIQSQLIGQTVKASGEYFPYLDSLKGGLSFLLQQQPAELQKISASLKEVQQLQAKLQDAEQVKQFIRARKQQLKDALSQYTTLPASLKKSLEGYNREAYYYAAQVREYKELFNNPDKLEQRALALLNKLPAFQSFMKEHSELAGLFRLPSGYADPLQGTLGLQTRDQVSQIISGRLGGGPNAGQFFQQQISVAQNQLNVFKDKLRSLGRGSGDMDMPQFKPNSQRTKTFLKRLEYGTNLQTQRSSYFFPTTSDLGLSVGYKLTDKSIAGLGVSYKIGWGRNIQHIAFSSQGLGLRSFVDVKLKASLYASGGWEYEYQRPFSSLQQIHQLDDWRQSGLLGISKVVSVKSRMFKKTKLQLLWDFLSYRQRPAGQPVKFRVGYSF